MPKNEISVAKCYSTIQKELEFCILNVLVGQKKIWRQNSDVFGEISDIFGCFRMIKILFHAIQELSTEFLAFEAQCITPKLRVKAAPFYGAFHREVVVGRQSATCDGLETCTSFQTASSSSDNLQHEDMTTYSAFNHLVGLFGYRGHSRSTTTCKRMTSHFLAMPHANIRSNTIGFEHAKEPGVRRMIMTLSVVQHSLGFAVSQLRSP